MLLSGDLPIRQEPVSLGNKPRHHHGLFLTKLSGEECMPHPGLSYRVQLTSERVRNREEFLSQPHTLGCFNFADLQRLRQHLLRPANPEHLEPTSNSPV